MDNPLEMAVSIHCFYNVTDDSSRLRLAFSHTSLRGTKQSPDKQVGPV
jgi:hypothetical protein